MYFLFMKKTSLKELKEDLSKWTECAARGERVYVSKYNKPYIVLIPSHSELEGITGTGEPFHLKPAVQRAISTKVLTALILDDRGEPLE
jgi:antitoxin (DNA-binding transcriptional repressor) of toxin-antitoxin stability system